MGGPGEVEAQKTQGKWKYMRCKEVPENLSKERGKHRKERPLEKLPPIRAPVCFILFYF